MDGLVDWVLSGSEIERDMVSISTQIYYLFWSTIH
jgi:hypothetical protein